MAPHGHSKVVNHHGHPYLSAGTRAAMYWEASDAKRTTLPRGGRSRRNVLNAADIAVPRRDELHYPARRRSSGSHVGTRLGALVPDPNSDGSIRRRPLGRAISGLTERFTRIGEEGPRLDVRRTAPLVPHERTRK